MKNNEELKKEILRLTAEYSRRLHKGFRPSDDINRKSWIPGEPIPYAGRVFNEQEVVAAVNTTLDFWLTLGSEGDLLQEEFAKYLGVKKTLLVNSGSSANLLAISCLTSHKLNDSKRIKINDEVITVAAGFPTTVAPILQVGAIPVFLDANPITGNIESKDLEKYYVEGKTKAVFIAHALGNPFNLYEILTFCKKYDLWLIEDNCDALGSKYSMPIDKARELGFTKNSPGVPIDENKITRWTGTWGDISTQSFYPPHHITMGEGGAVNIVNEKKLAVITESFRDWGRDCWCPSGIDNTCNKRFEWQLGLLPKGYDHKYTYSHLGFNLKPLDIQAAIGRIQLSRLNNFIDKRKENWKILRENLDQIKEYIEFALPTHATYFDHNSSIWDKTGCRSSCSWFGFMITVKESSPFTRTELAKELDNYKIGNRMFFGGNLLRQPAFSNIIKESPERIKTLPSYPGADKIMKNSLFLGTYPGLTKEMIDFESEIILKFVKSKI